MRNARCEEAAKEAVASIRMNCPHLEELIGAQGTPPIGVVLGTGWGTVLPVEVVKTIPFGDIKGFGALQPLEGHARKLIIGKLAGKIVLALSGRVHLNEAPQDSAIPKMVRLQTEMLLQLGVRQMIVTSAVGSLRGALEVGQIAVVNGFVTVFAPDMPLWAGEFCSPEDTLDEAMRRIAMDEADPLVAKEVGHVMVRGPQFEGRKYDKKLLARSFIPDDVRDMLAGSGAGVVGMSMLPEACVAALYDCKVLGLGFVTNDDVAAHSHEENCAQAAKSAEHLGAFLTRIVARL